MPAPTDQVPQFLNPLVWAALVAVARRFAERGLRVFLFGSFAAGTQRPGSDLDLGFEAAPGTPAALVAELRQAIEDLPTIRKIDLVDFGSADEEFLRVARAHVRELA